MAVADAREYRLGLGRFTGADGGGGEAGGRGRKLPLPREDDRFLDWLNEDQETRGESTADYARRLTISRAQLANAKAHRRGLSRPLVERICRTYPAARKAYDRLCLRDEPPAPTGPAP